MTSYTSKGQCVRGAVPKYINMSAFLLFRQEVEFVEAEIGVFAVRDHSDRELKRLRHPPVSYTHLRAHETRHDLVCRLLLEKKK